MFSMTTSFRLNFSPLFVRHNQAIIFEIFFHYIIRSVLSPAKSETVALADGVKSQAVMFADYFSVGCRDFPFFA